MNAPLPQHVLNDAALAEHIAAACTQIAPTWPLDRFIAVNPYWGHVTQPIEAAAATLGCLAGTRLLMPRSWFQAQWRAGHLTAEHLQAALQASGSGLPLATLTSALTSALNGTSQDAALPRLPLVTDLVGERRAPGQAMAWREVITHQISQHCAAYFDRDQAAWGPAAHRALGLWGSWRAMLLRDHGLPLTDATAFKQRLGALPADHRAAIAQLSEALHLPAAQRSACFAALLMSIGGWAAWCAYERWQAGLEGGSDDHIEQLLAIRLAWEWLLLEDSGLQALWISEQRDPAPLAAAVRAAQDIDWLLQLAMEYAYQAPVAAALAQAPYIGEARAPVSLRAAAQAVFCIDVRSEVFRRALERVSSRVQTKGFAGFFGLPIAYSPLGTEMTRPQLPGLLAPAQCVTEECESASLAQRLREKRRETLGWQQRWADFRGAAGSAFSFVETLGLSYAGKLLRGSLPGTGIAPRWEYTGLSDAEAAGIAPRLARQGDGATGVDAARVDAAQAILNAMNLTRDFAPIVLLAGHGSQSANNPHAAGLDCGACGGQSGEVNARVLAALLNEPAVRSALAERGLQIPADTHFVAGLHNTTLDEVLLYDLQILPATHEAALDELRDWLARAGRIARAERAEALGLAELTEDGASLETRFRQRSNDWAQVRPEWGLANNAAFIVAPRARSRHMNLAGRSFLHDYDWRDDAELKILELIMTAPMVVTNWINMQYHASTVDNRRYGSGNKVLHNVVGGRLGVFEGNGGDLRIGLPWQSLHDGTVLRHTPLRLSVFIEAPRESIDTIIARHAVVRQLVDGGWLHLFQIEPLGHAVRQRRQAQWVAVA
jgi:uncharacterized protein YbcC (UPF0753/DUF2309 family)